MSLQLSLLLLLSTFVSVVAQGDDCFGPGCQKVCGASEFSTYLSFFVGFLCLTCCAGVKRKSRGSKAAACVFIFLAIIFGSFTASCWSIRSSQEYFWLITTIAGSALGLCVLCAWCFFKISEDEERDVWNLPTSLACICLLGFLVVASVYFGLGKSMFPNQNPKVNCAKGFYLQGNQCQYCPLGSYCPGANQKVACPYGSFTYLLASDSVNSCTICRQGTFCKDEKSTTCPVGYYCPTGTVSPFKCPAGTFGNAPGLTTSSCSGSCAAGTYSREGATACSPCSRCSNPTMCTTTGCVCSSFGKWTEDCNDCAPGWWGPTCSQECEGGAAKKCFGGVCNSGRMGNGTCSCPSGACGSAILDVCGSVERTVYVIMLGVFFCGGCILMCGACKTRDWDELGLPVAVVSCFCVSLAIISSVTLGLCNAQSTSQEFAWLLAGCVVSLVFACCVAAATVAFKDDLYSEARTKLRLIAAGFLIPGVVFAIMFAFTPVFGAACPDGKYLAGTMCDVCPRAAYCPAGHLTPCEEGTLSTSLGRVTPCNTICPAGTYCPTGSSASIVCPIGSYCPAQSGAPILCPPFTYGSSTGLSTHACSGSCPYAIEPGARVCTNTSLAPTTRTPTATPTTAPTTTTPTPLAPTVASPTMPGVTPTSAPSLSAAPSLPPTRFPTTNGSDIDHSAAQSGGDRLSMDDIVIVLISLLAGVCVLCSLLYFYQTRKMRSLKSRMLSVPLVDHNGNAIDSCANTSEYVPPLSINSTAPSAPPMVFSPSAPPLPAMNPAAAAEEKEALTCVVCLDEPRDIAFAPCGHKVCCNVCANQVSQCPICRGAITNRLRVYD